MKARERIDFILGLPPAAVVQYLDEKLTVTDFGVDPCRLERQVKQLES